MTDEESSLFLNDHADQLRRKKTRTVFSRQQVNFFLKSFNFLKDFKKYLKIFFFFFNLRFYNSKQHLRQENT